MCYSTKACNWILNDHLRRDDNKQAYPICTNKDRQVLFMLFIFIFLFIYFCTGTDLQLGQLNQHLGKDQSFFFGRTLLFIQNQLDAFENALHFYTCMHSNQPQRSHSYLSNFELLKLTSAGNLILSWLSTIFTGHWWNALLNTLDSESNWAEEI